MLSGDDVPAMLECEEGTFPVPRIQYLTAWVDRPGVISLGIERAGRLSSFVVARPCVVGFKIGPMVAASTEEARHLLAVLIQQIPGTQLQWDVPEINTDAMALATELGLVESFSCGRMYLGAPPELDFTRLWGVTSFEFG